MTILVYNIPQAISVLISVGFLNIFPSITRSSAKKHCLWKCASGANKLISFLVLLNRSRPRFVYLTKLDLCPVKPKYASQYYHTSMTLNLF